MELLECINFAAEKHKNQRRKDLEATPYINHPIGVANILANEAGHKDVVLLQTAILHDVVEDTDASFEELESKFSKDVVDVVREVTDDKSLSKWERKNLQVTRMPGKSQRAQSVKLADKLYNLRDLYRATPVGWTTQRVAEYCHWAKQVTDEARGVCPKLDALLDEQYRKMEKLIHERRMGTESDSGKLFCSVQLVQDKTK
jgi:guanosine-3',5'-bis(diphosphate) 3'-pyrophosphohydrolase